MPFWKNPKRNPLGGGDPRSSLRNPFGSVPPVTPANLPPMPTDPLGGGEWFAVEVTEVTGTGATAVYSFKEINVEGGVGDTEDRVSGRVADKDVNPARSLDPGVTFSVGDPALARRNVADVNEFELAPVGGGSDTSFLVLLTEVVWSATFRQYSAVEVEASGTLTYAVKSGGRTFSPGTTPLYHERNEPYPVVGLSAGSPRFVHHLSVVRARQHPSGFWYFGEPPWVDIFRRDGTSDADGEVAFNRYNSANTGLTWADGVEVRLIEAE